jgi:transposase-like protein/IS1 family transposase
MVCHNCNSRCKKFGRHRNGLQRFRCKQCRKTFTEDHATPLGSMRTPLEDATRVIELLTEGCSVRSIERLTGIHHRTILALLVLVGKKCERLMENRICNLPVRDVQADEIWGFVGCKEKRNVSGNPLRGDAYCFIAIERNTKLVLTWHLGRRSARDAMAFTEKLEGATTGNFQLTTDGFKPYFAQLIKVYAASSEEEHRYSPPQVVETIAKPM